jgi:hypothetical protein
MADYGHFLWLKFGILRIAIRLCSLPSRLHLDSLSSGFERAE